MLKLLLLMLRALRPLWLMTAADAEVTPVNAAGATCSVAKAADAEVTPANAVGATCVVANDCC